MTIRIRRPAAQEGILSIVDLAGSEDIKDVDMSVKRRSEGQQMNRDLEEVGRYLDSLIGSDPIAGAENGSWLLERLSKTVRRGALMIVIATMSPLRAHYKKTPATLNFAQKASRYTVSRTWPRTAAASAPATLATKLANDNSLLRHRLEIAQ